MLLVLEMEDPGSIMVYNSTAVILIKYDISPIP